MNSYPTDDTRVITKAAVASLNELFQEGFKFSKAEILLMDLRQPNEFTGDLFAPSQPEASGGEVHCGLPASLYHLNWV